MSVWTMLFREIAYRKLNALAGLLGVAISASLIAGALLSLEIHAIRSETIVREKQAETQANMEALQADVKAAMHHLGYNAYLLPQDQPLADWYAEDYASKTMPETLATELNTTKGLFDRFLPRLRQRISWTERNWTVILIGVGQEQILDTSVCPDTPLITPIERGRCVVGFELHHALNLTSGQTIDILGTEFTIDRCEPERGTKDDVTLWLNLEDSQQLTQQTGQINEILIVEHLSVWGEPQTIQRQISQFLPDCQVVEMGSETMSRTHARIEVADKAQAAVEREQRRLELLDQERRRILSTFVPLGILVSAAWVGTAMYFNVRDRAQEIGVLMAQGFRGRTVRLLIFSKASLQGIVGGAAGCLLGAAAAVVWEGAGALAGRLAAVAGWQYLGLAVAVSTASCLLGSWLPASLAIRTDPAVVLREE